VINHPVDPKAYEYLRTLSNRGRRPNFWTSAEYFNRAGWRDNSFDGWVWIEDESGKCMLPPLIQRGATPQTQFPMGIDYVWSDFPNWGQPDWNKWFLDFEYLYRPKSFHKMEGKRWMKFRKNIRKWPRSLPDKIEPEYTFATPIKSNVEELFVEWMGTFGEGLSFYDPDVMADYVFHPPHHQAAYLYAGGKLMGMNIWDSNHMFINYRYAIHREEPFLNEYLRYCFYMDKWESLTIVNDGGCCGSKGLKQFKDTLNPWRIREVYTWEAK